MSEKNLNITQEQTQNTLTLKLKNEQQRNSKLLKLYNSEMQKNQAMSGALTKLKNFLEGRYNEHRGQEQQFEQQVDDVIRAEQAQQVIELAIQTLRKERDLKNKELEYTDQSLDIAIVDSETKPLSRRQRIEKSCQCQKWKSMYLKECDQSARLSQKYISLNNFVEQKEEQQKIDRSQIKKLLSDYLVLFKKYSIEQNISSASEKKNKSQELKMQKRSVSKGSHQKSKSRGKISSVGNQGSLKKNEKNPQKMKQNTQIISNCNFSRQQGKQITQQGHSVFIIEKFKRQMEILNANLSAARKQISQAEQIIKIYRQKQREQILYHNFIV